MHGNPRSFLRWFGAFVITAMVAYVALNVIVDPYWRFALVSIPGINAIKPQFTHQVRLGKAHQICRQSPANVILGSSRVEVAIDPEHPGFDRSRGTTYNLAMAGTGLWEMNQTLQHAYYASGQLRLAVLGLDFFMFNAHREAVVFGTEVFNFDIDRLILSPSDSCLRSFAHDIDHFIGRSGTLAAWRTIIDQHDPDLSRHEYYQFNGMRDQSNNMLSIVTGANGHRFVFSGQERAYVEKIWRAGPERRYCFALTGGQSTFDTLHGMVAFAYEHGIDLRFFIGPEHARMLFAVAEAGLWPQFEDWKREMVRTLDEEAARHGAAPFPLWDFSGFNSITSEPIPPPGDLQPMRWYWEGSHYKKATGDLMLDRLLGVPSDGVAAHPDFGTLLERATLEAHLDAIRDDMRRYTRDFPEEAQFIRTTVAEVIGDSGSNCGHDVEQVRLASAALGRGDQDAAELAFARAEAIHAAEQQRFTALGVPYREDGFAALLARARAGVEVSAPLADWQAYQNRAIERTEQGRLAEAVEDFTQAIRRGPSNTALHYLRGIALMHMQDYPRAIEDFQAGLRLDPANPALSVLLRQAGAAIAAELQRQADALRAQGDLAGAIAAYGEAIRSSAPNTALYYLRGTALLEMGDPAAAAEDFRAALRLDPNNGTLHFVLRQAEAGAAALPLTDPAAAAELQRQADALRAQGDLAGAIAAYGEAIRVGPPNTALHYLRGTAQIEAGDPAAAAEDFRAGLALDPGNAALHMLLDQAQAAAGPAAPATGPQRRSGPGPDDNALGNGAAGG